MRNNKKIYIYDQVSQLWLGEDGRQYKLNGHDNGRLDLEEVVYDKV